MLAYCSSAAPLFSLQSFYNYARGHCEAAQASNCSGVCWEEGMGGGGVLVLQDVGTMKSLHWRCEMWVDCVERKRSAKLPWSATAPCTFAAAPSFQACLRAFHMYILYVCVHICVCVYVCGHVYMYIYACVYVYVYVCVYTHVYVYVYAYLSQIVGLSISASACGRCHTCACVFACICMRIHMCVGIYICAYFLQ